MSFDWLEPYKEYGPLFVRAIIGWHLIYGTQDNVFSYARMIEFRDFLASHHFPYPLFSAFLSAHAQFICGGLYILGWFTRSAALVMIINFLVALAMVHWGKPYPQNALALWMLFGSVFLLIHGAGRLSVDARLRGYRD
jgi:putative oxidoreductase